MTGALTVEPEGTEVRADPTGGLEPTGVYRGAGLAARHAPCEGKCARRV